MNSFESHFPTFFLFTFRSCAGAVAPVREQDAHVILDSLSTDVATFSLADLGALQEYTKVSESTPTAADIKQKSFYAFAILMQDVLAPLIVNFTVLCERNAFRKHSPGRYEVVITFYVENIHEKHLHVWCALLASACLSSTPTSSRASSISN